tara:strand:+ start:359 stop:760 length:402 start_codon:yes stop_codon:yes gene_type:complete
MGSFVVGEVVKLMAIKKINIVGANILMLGLSFKENCPDLRNTRVIEMIDELQQLNAKVDVCDPWVNVEDVQAEYGLNLVETPANGDYDVIIIALAHDQFKALGARGIHAFGKANQVLYDIKYLLDSSETDGRL